MPSHESGLSLSCEQSWLAHTSSHWLCGACMHCCPCSLALFCGFVNHARALHYLSIAQARESLEQMIKYTLDDSPLSHDPWEHSLLGCMACQAFLPAPYAKCFAWLSVILGGTQFADYDCNCRSQWLSMVASMAWLSRASLMWIHKATARQTTTSLLECKPC